MCDICTCILAKGTCDGPDDCPKEAYQDSDVQLAVAVHLHAEGLVGLYPSKRKKRHNLGEEDFQQADGQTYHVSRKKVCTHKSYNNVRTAGRT